LDPVAAGTLPELSGMFSAPALTAPPLVTGVPLPGEFRVWEFIGTAWDLVRPHWFPLGAMFLIFGLIPMIPRVGALAVLVLGGPIWIGINRAILGVLDGRPPTIAMMFGGFDRFGQAFLAFVLKQFLVVVGLLLCIVPGVILAIMWTFTGLVLAETKLDFWASMQASAKLTEGYRWELFWLMLASLVVALVGLLVFCVGIFVAEAVIYTAVALAYRFLQKRQAERAA
jgi:uncharacterized membrane protein